MASSEPSQVESITAAADVENANASLPVDAKVPLAMEPFEVEDELPQESTGSRDSGRLSRTSGLSRPSEESLVTEGCIFPCPCACCYRCCGANFTGCFYAWVLWVIVKVGIDVAPLVCLALCVVFLLAFVGLKKARPGPECHPRDSIEALPAKDRSWLYWRYVCVMLLLEIPWLARKFQSLQAVMIVLATADSIVLILGMCAFVCVGYVFVHVRAKFFGDVLLGAQTFAACFAPARSLQSKVAEWNSRQDRGTFWKYVLDMASKWFWWRVLLVFLFFAIGNFMAEVRPGSKQVKAIALSFGNSFTRIDKRAEKEPFRKFIVDSWLGMASRDSPLGTKAAGVHVKFVLKLSDTKSTRLSTYKHAKRMLKMKRITPIKTRWNPAHLQDWDPRDKTMNLGIRTTAVLQQDAVRPMLEGLSDRNEDMLDGSINEAMLFHGTRSIDAVKGIMLGGFNIDLAGTSAGSLYGAGAYLADMASKSDDYAQELQKLIGFPEPTKYMILCKVALGESTRASRQNRLSPVGLHLRENSKYADGHWYNEYLIADSSQAYCPYTVVYRDEEDAQKHLNTAIFYFCLAAHLVAAWSFRVNRYFPG